jgi:site-specific recombinase XerD
VSVAEVFEKFLEWCQGNRSGRTYEWSRDHIQSFVDSLKARNLPAAKTPAEDLRPFHLTEWAAGHRTKRPGGRPWGPNHERGAITAVQRAFSWAAKVGHLDHNPVRHVEKPAPKRREQVLTRAEFDHLLSHVKDDAFRDVLEFCWETGCRVQEVRILEAGHLKAEYGRFELPPRQAKGKKRWRLIYLTRRAEEIVTPLARTNPEGPIFRNADGAPWDAQNFNCRFFRLQRRLGREALGGVEPDPDLVAGLARRLPKTRTVGKTTVVRKTEKELLREARKKLSGEIAAKAGTKYALTSIRHSFATRMLEGGCDHVTVALLMGHVDAVMLARVYSHVGERTDFLREALLRVSGGGTPAA